MMKIVLMRSPGFLAPLLRRIFHVPRRNNAIRVLFSMQKDKKAKKKGSLVQRELPR